MGDRETHFNSASHEVEAGQDARRTDYLWNIQNLSTRRFVNNRGHLSAEVWRNRDLDLSVFQHHEFVLLRYRPISSFAVADVRINTVGIQSRWNWPTRNEGMRENIILILKRNNFVWCLNCQARYGKKLGKQRDSHGTPRHAPVWELPVHSIAL